MSRTRTHLHPGLILLVLGAVLATAATFPGASSGAPARSADIIGFRAGGSRIVEPGGTIAGACSLRRIVAHVEFKNVPRGALVQRRWRYDGRLVKAFSGQWQFGSKKRIVRFQIANLDSLPTGRYQLAVKIPGKRWTIARVQLSC